MEYTVQRLSKRTIPVSDLSDMRTAERMSCLELGLTFSDILGHLILTTAREGKSLSDRQVVSRTTDRFRIAPRMKPRYENPKKRNGAKRGI